MNIEYIETFIQVFKSKSFMGAAKKMYISQSTLSTRILAMEKELGVTLFKRDRNGAILTSDGEKFLPYAIKIASTYSRAMAEFNGEQITFTVGCLGTLSETVLVNVIDAFHKQFPNVLVDIVTGATQKLTDAVISSQCTMAFVDRTLFEADALNAVQIYDEPVRIIVPPEHYFLSLNRSISLEELSYEPLLMKVNPIPSYWKELQNAFSRRALSPTIITQSDSFYFLTSLIKKNVGVSFIPMFKVLTQLYDRSLYSVAINPSELKIRRPIYCIMKKEPLSSYAAFFIKEFKNCCEESESLILHK